MEQITVREIRENILKIKQVELAKLLGLTRACYNNKELGKRNWKVPEILEISRLANVEPSRIKLK